MPLKILLFPASTIVPLLYCAFYTIRNPNGKRSSNILLGLLLIVITVIIINTILSSNWIFASYFPYLYISVFFILLPAPLFLLYTMSSIQKEFRFKPVYSLLLLPCFAIILYVSYKTFSYDLLYGKRVSQLPHILIEIIYNVFFISSVPFIIKNRISLRGFFGDFRDIRLTWVRFLYFSVSLFCFFHIMIAVFYQIFYMPEIVRIVLSAFFLYVNVFLFVIVYFFLAKSKQLFPEEKYKFSGLNDNVKSDYYNRILKILNDEKIYLDPELSLVKLADITGIQPKMLSQVVNEKANRHFKEFLNTFRVEYCCRLLSDPDCTKNILEIMFESGFNSKTTFNKAFKKQMNMTPVEYRLNKISK